MASPMHGHPMARKILVRRSAIHGNGVFAAVDIPADTRLIEYKGRVMTHRQADSLYDGSSETGHTFLFTLNDKYILDANVDGNDARWINHGCDPNCTAVLEEDEKGRRSKDRVFIESGRAIKAGEELTYNYGITLEERQTPRLKEIWACRCGSRKCTGTMLQPKRKR
jgi:SET domain-containing protein